MPAKEPVHAHLTVGRASLALLSDGRAAAALHTVGFAAVPMSCPWVAAPLLFSSSPYMLTSPLVVPPLLSSLTGVPPLLSTRWVSPPSPCPVRGSRHHCSSRREVRHRYSTLQRPAFSSVLSILPPEMVPSVFFYMVTHRCSMKCQCSDFWLNLFLRLVNQ
uniref:Uncharacterized protein n=1 Tax=Oryza meridionalis TaxID=40149 RepID=A0A0E0E293_9ORYZ